MEAIEEEEEQSSFFLSFSFFVFQTFLCYPERAWSGESPLSFYFSPSLVISFLYFNEQRECIDHFFFCLFLLPLGECGERVVMKVGLLGEMTGFCMVVAEEFFSLFVF